MTTIFIIIYMAVTYRMAGGGLWAYLLNKKGATDKNGNDLGGISPVNLTWVPELLFTLPIAVAFGFFIDGVFSLFGLSLLAFFVAWLWSYLWVQTGHKDALSWDEVPDILKDNTLTPVVVWLSQFRRVVRGSESYAWLFMAVKGFLVTLPAGGFGAIAFPLGYEIGSHARGRVEKWGIDPHAVSEIAVGALCGLILGLCGLILGLVIMGVSGGV